MKLYEENRWNDLSSRIEEYIDRMAKLKRPHEELKVTSILPTVQFCPVILSLLTISRNDDTNTEIIESIGKRNKKSPRVSAQKRILRKVWKNCKPLVRILDRMGSLVTDVSALPKPLILTARRRKFTAGSYCKQPQRRPGINKTDQAPRLPPILTPGLVSRLAWN